MTESLEILYFKWLCKKVGDTSYKKLLGKLHLYEFVWLLSGDDNRALDCHDLRLAFFREKRIARDEVLLYDMGYSVLEVLVAFSDRASFDTDMPDSDWFWIMVDNLGLRHFTDDRYPGDVVIDRILEIFVWRTYDANGVGGLFPVRHTNNDQRKVEIFYQFCEYLVENDM